ncbi:hypothetical protein FD755_001311 [Muntiacus reevesi]|uniref:Uncharacterized protein n=1 Tax=Muntiacus reevesi TaxID=9886 RepID=A0A5J5N1B1_MUNRE|nr:hypothetical protein FD755_001311 [Muntiacus reevesi]
MIDLNLWDMTEQLSIFQNKKRVLPGEAGKEKLPPYYKNTGLGFKIPNEDYLHYNHFEKHHKNMSVHLSPCFRDTVCFNMLKATKTAGTMKWFQTF